MNYAELLTEVDKWGEYGDWTDQIPGAEKNFSPPCSRSRT